MCSGPLCRWRVGTRSLGSGGLATSLQGSVNLNVGADLKGLIIFSVEVLLWQATQIVSFVEVLLWKTLQSLSLAGATQFKHSEVTLY